MSDREARRLASAYLDLLRTWLSCISRATLLGLKDTSRDTTVVRTNPRPIRLRSSDLLLIGIHHEFSVVKDQATRQSSIQSIGYQYEINDATGGEILAYHYHPTGPSADVLAAGPGTIVAGSPV